ncbi:hypothetical protein GYMLUDRAFT_79575, partial [Collybiopsis luxurians FD-317 M1]
MSSIPRTIIIIGVSGCLGSFKTDQTFEHEYKVKGYSKGFLRQIAKLQSGGNYRYSRKRFWSLCQRSRCRRDPMKTHVLMFEFS